MLILYHFLKDNYSRKDRQRQLQQTNLSKTVNLIAWFIHITNWNDILHASCDLSGIPIRISRFQFCHGSDTMARYVTVCIPFLFPYLMLSSKLNTLTISSTCFKIEFVCQKLYNYSKPWCPGVEYVKKKFACHITEYRAKIWKMSKRLYIYIYMGSYFTWYIYSMYVKIQCISFHG